MIQKDKILRRKADNYFKMQREYLSCNGKNKNYGKSMMMAFEDDLAVEFDTEEEIEQWVTFRDRLWVEEYNMRLNTAKTVILMKEGNKKEITAGEEKYRMVKEVKYLGTTLRTKKIDIKELKIDLHRRIEKAVMAAKRAFPNMSKRLETTHLQSVYRFFITPLILTKELPLTEASNIWASMQKKLYRAPSYISKLIPTAARLAHLVAPPAARPTEETTAEAQERSPAGTRADTEKGRNIKQHHTLQTTGQGKKGATYTRPKRKRPQRIDGEL